MIAELDSMQHRLYREQGFLVVEDFLNAIEIKEWQDILEAAVNDGIGAGAMERPAGLQDDYYRNVFIQLTNQWRTMPDLRRLATNPRLGRIATALAGVTGLRLLGQNVFVKQPWSNATNWHVDNPADPFYSRQEIMQWIALDDVTIQNGCLYFLPGTHLQSEFKPTAELKTPDVGQLFRSYPQFATIEPVPTPIRAGSCVYINGMVAHAAGPNMTPRPRRGMSIVFMPVGSTYNGIAGGTVPQELRETLQVGDSLDLDDTYPQVYPV